MAEFTGGNEEYISVRDPIVFENKTESQYEVCAGIVFHKSGIYEVSVVGNKTIVSEVPEKKTGHWEWGQRTGEYVCSECGCNPIYERTTPDVSEIDKYRYCRWCGSPMEVDG